MSIIIDESTRVIVQGLGTQGSFHAKLMKESGTKIEAAISTSKKGDFEGIPLYSTVKEAMKNTHVDFSILFVPAPYTKSAALESIDNGLNLVIITEGVPVHDSIEIMRAAKEKNLIVIGPNCPGIISPGKSKIGIMPIHIFKKGCIGVVSMSGTLTYEIVMHLSKNGIGQSTVIGIGGDPVIGMDFVQALKLFEKDKETDSVILIGEIGGNLEERASEFIKSKFSKKVIAYIAGRTAPTEKRMGHAGAIIEGTAGTAESKINALKEAGVEVAEFPSDIVKYLNKKFDF